MNDEILVHLLTIAGSAVAAWLASRPASKAAKDQQAKIESEITEKVLTWCKEHTDELEQEITELKANYEALLAENKRLRNENIQLRARVSELETQLKKMNGGS